MDDRAPKQVQRLGKNFGDSETSIGTWKQLQGWETTA
jgi:hypothetical protein